LHSRQAARASSSSGTTDSKEVTCGRAIHPFDAVRRNTFPPRESIMCAVDPSVGSLAGRCPVDPERLAAAWSPIDICRDRGLKCGRNASHTSGELSAGVGVTVHQEHKVLGPRNTSEIFSGVTVRKESCHLAR